MRKKRSVVIAASEKKKNIHFLTCDTHSVVVVKQDPLGFLENKQNRDEKNE